jgi:hypothetical protein
MALSKKSSGPKGGRESENKLYTEGITAGHHAWLYFFLHLLEG